MPNQHASPVDTEATMRITFECPVALRNDFLAACKKTDRTQSVALRDLMRLYISQVNAKEPRHGK